MGVVSGCCIGLKHPESGGTVPLFYTLSRLPKKHLFIPLFAHPRARMRITRKWVDSQSLQTGKCLLALPVSNAETEGVFSLVRKIITDYNYTAHKWMNQLYVA